MANKKEIINKNGLSLVECETTPPSRYSEAALVKALEIKGIGRPSTFSNIVSTILDPGRNYCEEQGKAISPTDMGMKLSKFLDEAFPKIINYEYSSQLEESLDKIAKGKLNEVDFLKEFYSSLEEQIKSAKGVESQKPEKEYSDEACPQCGSKLVKRRGRFGEFWGCSAYPKCKYTQKI